MTNSPEAIFITSVSESFAIYARKQNANVSLIYPMIDFEETGRCAVIYDESVKTPFTVLFVGRLNIDKGILDLERVIDSFDSKDSVCFKIVGGGTEYVRLQEKYALSGFVEILGQVSNKNILEDQFLASHLFLLPSYKEGFPRVLYESMLKGLPIATTFVGAVSDIMQPEENCLALIPGDLESIRNAIENIRGNSDLARSLALKAKSTMVLVKEREIHSTLVSRLICEIR